MLNETNSELQERSDSAAIEEMLERTDVQIPARIYAGDLNSAFDIIYEQHARRGIEEQQQIEAEEWNEY